MWYFLMSFHAIQSSLQCWTHSYSWLTRVYVSVNAFRALFPVNVTERLCLTTVSSPFIDRGMSTISEMCFAKQLSDSLYRPSWILFYAWAAQICCWFAVITKNNLFHVYEEYLWFLIGYSYYWYTPIPSARYIALVYCFYMLFLDIPMYAYRFLLYDAVPLSEGLLDMNQCTRHFNWEEEYLWRTGYFVGASRLSMYIDSIY